MNSGFISVDLAFCKDINESLESTRVRHFLPKSPIYATVIMGLLVLVFAIMSSIGAMPAVFASTTIDVNSSGCSAIGGSWNSSTSTCTLSSEYTINSGNILSIPKKTTLVMSFEIDNYGTMNNLGTFNSSGVFYNYAGTLVNSGTINNTGILYNGYLTPDSQPYGPAISGSIINSGTINSSGEIDNWGNITNYHQGRIDSSGTIYNAYYINPPYQPNDLAYATINNFGAITNSGYFVNWGNVTTQCGGHLYNEVGSTFIKVQGSTFSQVSCTTTTSHVVGVPEFPSLGLLGVFALMAPLMLLIRWRSRQH